MSHSATQQTVVRMLFDAAYAERVFSAPEETLAGVDLTVEERTWVTRSDPRAYRTDPHRCERALGVIVEEFPVSCTLLARQSGSVDELHAFFASAFFCSSIFAGRPMALAFGDYLAALAARPAPKSCPLAEIARVEHAIAQVRRAPRAPLLPAAAVVAVSLAPTARVLRVTPGLLDYYGQCLAVVRSHPRGAIGAVVDPDLALPARPPSGPPEATAADAIIVDFPSGAEGPTLEMGAPALVDLLEAAERQTLSREDWIELAAGAGASNQEALELWAELLTDGLLAAAPRGRAVADG
ncbi:MAG: hypothetical protein HYV63_10995 [Candidatus Schekmanbacteria bacterium]|nr:hypothetical protein [Candidatus Schekmanbacteria bacterium]